MNKINYKAAAAAFACCLPVVVNASDLAPAASDLADLYGYSCKACHSSAASGAPLAGDAEAWAPRIAQGMDVLLERTINGYQGMPPLGSCTDCTVEDFVALIQFMSVTESIGE